MTEIKNLFKPEINPFHERGFSIVAQLDTTDVSGKTYLPAGTILKSAADGKAIELDPTKGVKVATVADVKKPLAVLAHDVQLELGQTKYSVGVVIKGVVYQDVMEQANTPENFTEAIIAKLAPNILTYNVITLGK